MIDSTMYDPALDITVPVQDARDSFIQSDDGTTRPTEEEVFASHYVRRRQRPSILRSAASSSIDDGHSRAIGFWPKPQSLVFTSYTALRNVIIFPDSVGGDFSTFLYMTSSNRSNYGTEAHIAYVNADPTEFWIYDWSLLNHRLARRVPISKMSKYVFPVTITTQGYTRNGLLVMNQTRLLESTTWMNCVYLGVFQGGTLDHFDAVYSNDYLLDSNTEQQPGCNGYWGPEIESFQDYSHPINAMGFSGCWLIQNGIANPLSDANTQLHDDAFGPKIIYQNPSRDFLVS
jgi:hypothetical protein